MKQSIKLTIGTLSVFVIAACAQSPQLTGANKDQRKVLTQSPQTSSNANPYSPDFQKQTYQQEIQNTFPTSNGPVPQAQTQGVNYGAYQAPIQTGGNDGLSPQTTTAIADLFGNLLNTISNQPANTNTSPNNNNPQQNIQTDQNMQQQQTQTSNPTPPIVTGYDACNDPANASFPGFPQFKILRKDGYMTMSLMSVSNYARVGQPITRFPGFDTAEFQAQFQGGYIYRGSSQYSTGVVLGFLASDGGLKAVVSWTDGTMKYVGDVTDYTPGMALPAIVTVKFGHGACVAQYGDSGGKVSGGTGYLLIP